MIVLSGDALVDELRKLPDEVMSFHEAAVKVSIDPTDSRRTSLINDVVDRRNEVHDGSRACR